MSHLARKAVAAGIQLSVDDNAAADARSERDHQHILHVFACSCGRLAERRAVVRLHVIHHHIVQGPAGQGKLQVLEEPLPHGLVHRVHQDRLFIQHQIGIV